MCVRGQGLGRPPHEERESDRRRCGKHGASHSQDHGAALRAARATGREPANHLRVACTRAVRCGGAPAGEQGRRADVVSVGRALLRRAGEGKRNPRLAQAGPLEHRGPAALASGAPHPGLRDRLDAHHHHHHERGRRDGGRRRPVPTGPANAEHRHQGGSARRVDESAAADAPAPAGSDALRGRRARGAHCDMCAAQAPATRCRGHGVHAQDGRGHHRKGCPSQATGGATPVGLGRSREVAALAGGGAAQAEADW